MAHVHDHGTTVVEDRSGTSLLAVVLIVGLVALLAWFLFFSGIVMDRDTATDDVNRTEIRDETNEGDTNIINPPQDTTDGTTGDTSQPTTAP